MYILGIGGSDHDFACALCKDGEIIVAIEEERISRKKHGIGLVETLELGKSVKYCLDYAQITRADLDLVVSNDLLRAAPLFGFKNFQIINHHLAHAASAYFASGYDSSAILVIDAAGSEVDGSIETTTLAIGQNNEIYPIAKIFGTRDSVDGLISNSIGQLYSLVTENIGFRTLQEGKTMGLAPYGTEKYYKQFQQYVHMLPKGEYSISHSALIECQNMILAELGACSDAEKFQVKADFARAVQEITNEVILHIAKYLAFSTAKKKLCYAGGVALNSVTNGLLEKNGLFDSFFVQPGAGDSGTAIGAALWGYFGKASERSKYRMTNSFLGRQYSSEDITKAESLLLSSENTRIELYEGDSIYQRIAHILNSDEPICVFFGRSEFGPRALGNRSILCSATEASTRDRINSIKGREWFRPLAPAVMQESRTIYFCSNLYDPFMLFVDSVQPQRKHIIPAVVHVDDSARTQSVSMEDNYHLYMILSHYYKISGIPLVLNTSFNIGPEPIVETPFDAISSFLKSDIHCLAIDNHLIIKSGGEKA